MTKWMPFMMPVLVWRVIYLGGKIHTGTTHDEWKALPEEGVIVVALVHKPPYKSILTGHDWYVWDGDRWGYVHSPAGPISTGTWLPKPEACNKCIKRGDATTDDEFHMWDSIALAWAENVQKKMKANA
jgi:hypothetical protein